MATAQSLERWLCALFLVQDLLDLAAKCRGLVYCYIPDDFVVHAEVGMNEPVSHACHGPPLSGESDMLHFRQHSGPDIGAERLRRYQFHRPPKQFLQ